MPSEQPLVAPLPRHIGDMNTPGQNAAQRVIHTNDAFFRKFVSFWLFFCALIFVYTFFWEPASFYVGVIGVGSSLLAKFFLYRGQTYLARWVFITPFYIALLISPWLVNGIRTPLLIHMMIVLVLTGWMLGTRVMWFFTLSLSAMLMALWYAESSGIWAMPQALRGIDMWLISLQSSLIVAGVMVSELIRNYRVDIERETTWQQLLHNTLQFNALIIDSSPVPIRVFGPDGQCLAVNDAYAGLMGNTRENLLAQRLQDRAMKTSGLAEEGLQVLASGQPAEREVQVTNNAGRELWLKAHLVPFDRDGQRHLLAHFIDLTAYRHATLELKQLAFHDSLTGLANRRLFWEYFQQAQQLCMRHQQWGAVLLLDLNRFKQLNDQHGHAAGDAMLQEVARRMQQSMRATDVTARLGGDEFTLLLQDLGSTQAQAIQNVQQLCEKLHAALAQPYQLGNIKHSASASIGFALMDPTQDNDLDNLLRHADAQMYLQKKLLTQADAAIA